MPGGAIQELRQGLDRLTAECRAVGQAWEDAASRLARGEALPDAELIEQLGQLRSGWDLLLAEAARATSEGGGEPPPPPDPAKSLGEAIAFVDSAIDSCSRRAERAAERTTVLELLSWVVRLESRDGRDIPGLDFLLTGAGELALRVREAGDPSSLSEFDAIISGSHGYCQLRALVEPGDDPGTDRIGLAIDCTSAFGRAVAKAAAEGQLAAAPGPGAGAPAAEKPAAPEAESGVGREPERARPAESPERPAGDPNVPTAPRQIPTSPSGQPAPLAGPAPASRVEPLRARPSPPRHNPPRPRAQQGASQGRMRSPKPILGDIDWPLGNLTRDTDIIPIQIVSPAGTPTVGDAPASNSGGAIDEPAPGRPPTTAASSPEAQQGRLDPPADSLSSTVAETPVERGTEPVLRPVQAPPGTSATRPDAASPPPSPCEPACAIPGVARAACVADHEEILTHCRRGDYLRAGLLAAGRAFAGLPGNDPGFEALLVAHHALEDSWTSPWPDWCDNPVAAATACEDVPESVRLVFLAALCQLSRAGTGGDPLAQPVKRALLTTFNHLPELRTWLDEYLDAAGIPGLWDRICRPEGPKAFEAYREARAAYLKRYEGGLQHRNPHAAYIHKLDHFASRLAGAKLLHDYLKPDGPGPLPDAEHAEIQAFLREEPEALTGAWLRSTIRPTAGGIQLRGNQRADLARRAADYLERGNRAWRAAESLRQSGSSPGDVEGRRERFRGTLTAAKEQSRGELWDPLFDRLTEGLLP